MKRAVPVTALALALASCTPWTVRPIDSDHSSSGTSTAATPAAYVDSIWSSKLLPAISKSAVDARVLLDALAASPAGARTRYGRCDAGGPCYFAVKGEGVVTAVDTRSRAGLALVDIAPFDKRADLSIQIGPVIRGTSLRDATGVIRFTDFLNQLQFADAANELNDRVLKTVLAPLDKARLKGAKVSFLGTLTLLPNADPPLGGLVPVELKVEVPR